MCCTGVQPTSGLLDGPHTPSGGFVISDEADSDRDLNGASPRVIGLTMTIITLAFPLGVLPSGMVPNIWMQESESWIVYGVFWAFDTGSSYQPFGYVTYAILFLLLPVCVFNILYIRQIMRYYYGRSSRDSAISCGLISVLLPTLIGLAVNGFYLPDGGFLFAGAVPIQFVAGLIILYKIPGPELISPWQGVFLDGSWWTRRKNKAPDWFNDVFALWEEYVDLERVDE